MSERLHGRLSRNNDLLCGRLSGSTAIRGFVSEMVKGDNAYQVAVANGFAGTEQEWLESLIGPRGPAGPPGEYELPTASPTTLGGVKIGEGLQMQDGILSVSVTEIDTITKLNIDNLFE